MDRPPPVSNDSSSPSTRLAPGPLVLPARLVVGHLAGARDELLARLADDGPIELDGASVDEVDSAGLQLIVAFVGDARRAGRSVRTAACSPRLAELAGVLGLADTFSAGGAP